MRLYQDFYESFLPFDSGFERVPQLVFACEDDKHMVEAFKEIVTNKIEIDKIKLYFTTDLKQNATSLDKSLLEFVIDEQTGKYKVQNVEIKLLG